MYIDVHCHLTGGDYAHVGGVSAVVERAKADGVGRIICSGCDLDCSFEGAEIARKYDGVYFCTGFHPGELKKYKEGDLEKIASLCSDEKCRAVGEQCHLLVNSEADRRNIVCAGKLKACVVLLRSSDRNKVVFVKIELFAIIIQRELYGSGTAVILRAIDNCLLVI